MSTSVQTLYQAPTPKRASPAPDRRSQPLSPGEEALLFEMYTYDLVTVKQCLSLHYQQKSLNYVGSLLRSTVVKGYALQDSLPRKERCGSAPWVFFLSGKGRKHFLDLGYPAPATHSTPAEVAEYSYLFWKHTLAVTDILIAARLFADSSSSTLAAWQSDRQLRTQPIYVPGENGEKRIGVVPDVWLDFRLPPLPGQRVPTQLALHLELDRGTIPVGPMKRKFRALLRYLAGPYQARFHTTSITIGFPTTAGQPRADALRSWCEQVLHEQKAEQEAAFFYFTSLPPQPSSLDLGLDPQTFFHGPVWSVPFQPNNRVLLQP